VKIAMKKMPAAIITSINVNALTRPGGQSRVRNEERATVI